MRATLAYHLQTSNGQYNSRNRYKLSELATLLKLEIDTPASSTNYPQPKNGYPASPFANSKHPTTITAEGSEAKGADVRRFLEARQHSVRSILPTCNGHEIH